MLAALSLVLGAAGAMTMSSLDGDRLRAGLLAFACHTTAAAAAALLLRDLRPDARRMPWLFLAAAVLAAGALQVFTAGFAASWDAADAGIPSPPITRLALPALALALVALGTAIGVALATFRRGPAGAVTLWRPVALGIVIAIPGLMLLFNPFHFVVVPIGVGAAILVRMWRRSPRPTPAQLERRSGNPTARPGAARLVRPLAGGALAIVAAVWATGIWIGVAATGTELATTAMGVSAAAAQLGAVPLFLAVAAILTSMGRARNATTPVALSLTAGGLLTGSAIALIGYSPDGSSLYLGAAVSGASLGLWLAAASAGILPTRFERAALGVGAMVAGVAVWYLLVPLTGGFGLAVLAGVVLGVGPRPFTVLSRVSAAASP